jgi:hypothetical protein
MLVDRELMYRFAFILLAIWTAIGPIVCACADTRTPATADAVEHACCMMDEKADAPAMPMDHRNCERCGHTRPLMPAPSPSSFEPPADLMLWTFVPVEFADELIGLSLDRPPHALSDPPGLRSQTPVSLHTLLLC